LRYKLERFNFYKRRPLRLSNIRFSLKRSLINYVRWLPWGAKKKAFLKFWFKKNRFRFLNHKNKPIPDWRDLRQREKAKFFKKYGELVNEKVKGLLEKREKRTQRYIQRKKRFLRKFRRFYKFIFSLKNGNRRKFFVQPKIIRKKRKIKIKRPYWYTSYDAQEEKEEVAKFVKLLSFLKHRRTRIQKGTCLWYLQRKEVMEKKKGNFIENCYIKDMEIRVYIHKTFKSVQGFFKKIFVKFNNQKMSVVYNKWQNKSYTSQKFRSSYENKKIFKQNLWR